MTRTQEQADLLTEGTDLLDLFQGVQDVVDRPDVSVEALGGSDGLPHTGLLYAVVVGVKDLISAGEVLLDSFELTPQDKARMEMIAVVVERFTGKPIQLMDPATFVEAREVAAELASEQASTLFEVRDGGLPRRAPTSLASTISLLSLTGSPSRRRSRSGDRSRPRTERPCRSTFQ